MEFKYTLLNTTTNEGLEFIVRNGDIIDTPLKANTYFIGLPIHKALESLFIWGHNIVVYQIELVGLTDIADVIYRIEELVKPYIPAERERFYVKLLYPDGHFGYIEYDGSDEHRFKIIKEHTDLFGKRVDLDLRTTKAVEYKKAIPKNDFSFDL